MLWHFSLSTCGVQEYDQGVSLPFLVRKLPQKFHIGTEGATRGAGVSRRHQSAVLGWPRLPFTKKGASFAFISAYFQTKHAMELLAKFKFSLRSVCA